MTKISVPQGLKGFIAPARKTRKQLKLEAMALQEQSRKDRAARLAKHLAAVRKRRELRDWWRKKIGKEEGVNWKRVCLNTKVSNKKVKPGYVIRKSKGEI